MCFIPWDRLCLLKCRDGVGVRRLDLMNKALIGKLMWRLATSNNQTWVRLLKGKYNVGNNFWDAAIKRKYTPIWRSIVKIKEELKPHLCWEINDGASIRVWTESWVKTLLGFRAERNVQVTLRWNLLPTSCTISLFAVHNSPCATKYKQASAGRSPHHPIDFCGCLIPPE